MGVKKKKIKDKDCDILQNILDLNKEYQSIIEVDKNKSLEREQRYKAHKSDQLYLDKIALRVEDLNRSYIELMTRCDIIQGYLSEILGYVKHRDL